MVYCVGNSEQWFPFLTVGNLSVNCWPTGYRRIINTLLTVGQQC